MKEIKTTLIKPQKKEKDKNKITIFEPIFLLILGIILLTNSSKAVIIIFYFIGAIFILVGAYNLFSYSKIKKELKIDDNGKLILGTSALFIGIIILLLSGAIETFLRFIIGIILIFNGIKNSLVSLNTKSYVSLLVGILFIGMGLYTILAENIIFQIIGALLIVASIVDFIGLLSNKK